jgi:hypothetical protein
MSCWVVPSVAAEMWGMSVCQIMERVKAGMMPSRQEFGFTTVDIAPQTPRVEPVKARFRQPKTYVHAASGLRLASDDPGEERELFTSDWRQRRVEASLLRRRPAA